MRGLLLLLRNSNNVIKRSSCIDAAINAFTISNSVMRTPIKPQYRAPTTTHRGLAGIANNLDFGVNLNKFSCISHSMRMRHPCDQSSCSHLRSFSMQVVALKKCHGCGSEFQSHQKELPGFVPENKLTEYNEALDIYREQEQNGLPLDPLPKLICMRCHRMRFQSEVISIKVQPGEGALTKRGKKEITTDQGAALINVREHIRVTLRRKINSLIVQIVDVFDFEGTLIPDLIDYSRHPYVPSNKPLRVSSPANYFLVINKIDLLPEGYVEERVKRWAESVAKRNNVRIDPVDIFLVSSKSGKGVYSVIQAISKMKAERKISEVHVVGCTNTGKSSFINRIMTIEKASQEKMKDFQKQVEERKKIQQSSPVVLDEGNEEQSAQEETQQVEEEIASNETEEQEVEQYLTKRDKRAAKRKAFLNKQKEDILTTSPIPGTTLGLIHIDSAKGYLIVDTPGIVKSSHQQISLSDALSIIPKKRISPEIVRLSPGKTVFLGGLCRIDNISGTPMYFTFFKSSQLKTHLTDSKKALHLFQTSLSTILKPPSIPPPEFVKTFDPFSEEKVDSVYEPAIEPVRVPQEELESVTEYKNLFLRKWKKLIVNAKGITTEKGDIDISISGLGWVCISGEGSCTVAVYTPRGIAANVRPSLMPFETSKQKRKTARIKKHGRAGPSPIPRALKNKDQQKDLNADKQEFAE